MKQLSAAVRALKKSLNPNLLFEKEEDRYAASMDNLRLSRLPSVVIKPEAEEDIASVLKIANKYKIPLTTRGAGSATTGSASPVEKGWVLDLSDWNRVHIDAKSKMAYVQPGASLESIDQAAAKYGLSYPPDPGSKKYATIGGTIATNAGGLRGAKYGVTRDYIYALEGFLPNGEFVRWGADLRKFSAGFNIRDLWIGSEGMLGIITGAVLKLLPRPASVKTGLLAFSTEAKAIRAIKKILKLPACPSVLELLDQQTLNCTRRFWTETSPEKLKALPRKLSSWMGTDKKAALVLIEVDGRNASDTSSQIKAIRKAVESEILFFQAAKDDLAAETLWTIRRGCSQAMFQLGDTKLNEDIVIPLDCYGDLFKLTRQITLETGLATPTFGHAADGNFHVHIMYNRKNAEERKKAAIAIQRLMESIVSWGGVISGEHGIGLAKSEFLRLQHGEAEIEAMQSIKNALDPNNILNPDKLFFPTSPWDFPREEVRLPWDH